MTTLVSPAGPHWRLTVLHADGSPATVRMVSVRGRAAAERAARGLALRFGGAR